MITKCKACGRIDDPALGIQAGCPACIPAMSAMIRQIVGRMHVLTPDDTVKKYVLSRFTKAARAAMTSLQRFEICEEIVRIHRANLDEYQRVMSA